MFLRAGEKLTWYPSTRKARIKQIQTAIVSLTSCVGKLMEQSIKTCLVWHLEKNNIIIPRKAGFSSTVLLKTR